MVFMGTPVFAVPALEALINTGHQVALVVTQPDRPRGRGGVVSPPPVKDVALTHGMTVFQPIRVKEQESIARIRDASPEAIIVAAYGKILPREILSIPSNGCINIHASLLPKYRGAAPIQWALLKGEEETGVTTMLMDEGLDTGDILLQKAIPITDTDNFGTLYTKLSEIGAELLIETLSLLQKGTLSRRPQEHGEFVQAPPLTKSDEKISWTADAKAICDRIRALDPSPGARTFLNVKLLKIWRAKEWTGEGTLRGLPGEVIGSNAEGIIVQAGTGAVLLQELQAAGSRRLPAAVFLRGHPLPAGTILGE
ncbi:MAG: methionyl-tRNA formyltransferase [Bacillota bacterium]